MKIANETLFSEKKDPGKKKNQWWKKRIKQGPGRIGDISDKTDWRQTYWRQITPPTLLATVSPDLLATDYSTYLIGDSLHMQTYWGHSLTHLG